MRNEDLGRPYWRCLLKACRLLLCHTWLDLQLASGGAIWALQAHNGTRTVSKPSSACRVTADGKPDNSSCVQAAAEGWASPPPPGHQVHSPCEPQLHPCLTLQAVCGTPHCPSGALTAVADRPAPTPRRAALQQAGRTRYGASCTGAAAAPGPGHSGWGGCEGGLPRARLQLHGQGPGGTAGIAHGGEAPAQARVVADVEVVQLRELGEAGREGPVAQRESLETWGAAVGEAAAAGAESGTLRLGRQQLQDLRAACSAARLASADSVPWDRALTRCSLGEAASSSRCCRWCKRAWEVARTSRTDPVSWFPDAENNEMLRRLVKAGRVPATLTIRRTTGSRATMDMLCMCASCCICSCKPAVLYAMHSVEQVQLVGTVCMQQPCAVSASSPW